uniref:Uncharacterized protein n=1 Tax=Zonotrichia albicollis TaxID=44394 RepID=A0A8D2MAQ0_ZONAL
MLQPQTLRSLLGHQDVVRDLSFAPNGSPILVSASRDKTLRVWDLSRDGRNVQGHPCAGSGKGEKPILGGKVVEGTFGDNI